ncbi:Msw1 [Kluyveromyces lactis]|nr:Msw1 [Kluyveromyces lactis]
MLASSQLVRNKSRVLFRRFNNSVKTTGFKLRESDLPKNATIFSLIQPTGKFHLGNYLGAVRVWKDITDLKDDGTTLLFGTADLHAITVPKPNAKEFRNYRIEAIASILSIGIDPEKAIVFHQSKVSQHTELHWLLSSLASMGSLNRMTQWKSKSNINDQSDDAALGAIKLGLFSYPVLQAADILLYKSTHVPVGDDQSQHLELTRQLSNTFNKFYKTKYFPMPTTILAPTKKILSLLNPEKKMSKSDTNQNSVIYITDEPEIIAKKIRRAVTDSISDSFYFDPVNRPGISNLINTLSGVQRVSIEDVEKDIAHIKDHKDFKQYVTDVLVEELAPSREQFHRYMKNPDYLHKVSEDGASKAREIAEENITEIKRIMGFL